MAPTAAKTLTLAASQIGTGESPANVNKFTRWYYGKGTPAPWCYIFISWVFGQLNAIDLVHGKHAYVPDAKDVFSEHGEWHSTDPQPGDLAVFNWDGGLPDHIGFVEKVLSATEIQTIEGNTSDHVYRRVRARSYVQGYCRPKYAAPSTGSTPFPGRYLAYSAGHEQMHGSDVEFVQKRLGAHGHKVTVDDYYGPKTADAVRAFQKDAHLTVDGIVGPETWKALAHA